MLETLLAALEGALRESEFGAGLLARTYLLQLMIHLNRVQLRDQTSREEGVSRADPKITQVLAYINGNLGADLSVEALAGPGLFQPVSFHAPVPGTDRLLRPPVCQ